MLLRSVAACVLALCTGSAGASEMLESDFQVTYQYGGTEHRLSEDRVPLLPSNACYTWWIRLAEGAVPQSVEERLILPEPLADWGDLATNPSDGVEISTDSTTATWTLPTAR